MFLEGAKKTTATLTFEVDTDRSVCDGVIDLDGSGGNSMSGYMKVHPTNLETCLPSSIVGKKTAEEVFKIQVPAGVRVKVDLVSFRSSVGDRALVDARWGGACAASGAGANKVLCTNSAASPVSINWKNDQGSAQPLFFTLEPAGDAAATTAKAITGVYSIEWTKYADACASAVSLNGVANGELVSVDNPPPAWASQ